MSYETTYTEAVKKLSFHKFKESHEWIDRFKTFSDEDWENEYEKATGKQVKKGDK